MCMRPLSGPSQRNWLSPVSDRANAPMSATTRSTGCPTTSAASARMPAT